LRLPKELRCSPFLIDGEAIASDDNGVAVFQKLRQRRGDRYAVLCALYLLELDGRDLRREPIERRKAALKRLIAKGRAGLQLNDHITEPGDVVFRHACQLGLEGIVSKRLGSRYRSGRSPDWLKFKNPAAPAVKREADEDWGKERDGAAPLRRASARPPRDGSTSRGGITQAGRKSTGQR